LSLTVSQITNIWYLGSFEIAYVVLNGLNIMNFMKCHITLQLSLTCSVKSRCFINWIAPTRPNLSIKLFIFSEDFFQLLYTQKSDCLASSKHCERISDRAIKVDNSDHQAKKYFISIWSVTVYQERSWKMFQIL